MCVRCFTIYVCVRYFTIYVCAMFYHICVCAMFFQNVDCQNHIKIVFEWVPGELFVCGSGSYSPRKYNLQVTSTHLSFHLITTLSKCLK